MYSLYNSKITLWKCHGYQTYGSREHADIHCSIDARKYDYLDIIGVDIFALNMNSRIECHREDRENLKPANISTHTVYHIIICDQLVVNHHYNRESLETYY
jgi:hypothetical protein